MTIDPKKLARSSDPETSKMAAEEFANSKTAHALRSHVIDTVKANPGLTSRELATQTDEVSYENFHKRLPEVERTRDIHRGVSRRCRVTNRTAATWYPGPEGTPEQMDLI